MASEVLTAELLDIALEEHTLLQRNVLESKYTAGSEKNLADVLNRCFGEFLKSAVAATLSETQIKRLHTMLHDKLFIPGGSILSGYGVKGRRSSLSNCYVTPIENDSIEAIFAAQSKIARTFSYRGGTGVDITVLRPNGTAVNNAAKSSTGAVSFMPSFSEVTNTICQAGRRGALLISLDIRHPDVLSFIWSKSKPDEVFGKDKLTGKTSDISGANISLKVTRAFTKAVEDDASWDFVFPDIEADKELYDAKWCGDYEVWSAAGGKVKVYNSVPARTVLSEICKAAHASGDPGLLFIDQAQEMTPGTWINEKLKPVSSNPCGC